MKLYYFCTWDGTTLEIGETEVLEETERAYFLINGVVSKTRMWTNPYYYTTTYSDAIKKAICYAEGIIKENERSIERLTQENEAYSARIAELQKILEEGNRQ